MEIMLIKRLESENDWLDKDLFICFDNNILNNSTVHTLVQ